MPSRFWGTSGNALLPGAGFFGGSGFPGPELIVNGGFNDASVWTLGGGCTISGGVLNATSGAQLCYQPITYVTGAQYTLTFVYTMSSGANLRANLVVSNGADVPAGGTSGTLSTSGGTVTLTFVVDAAATGIYIEAANATFTGTIDNVSLKRTG